ncbi:MAG: hypothetical protein JW909_06480 [Planctomycetes bacterium]|nr:hypothetical protein [Planctomycetota bacterium]
MPRRFRTALCVSVLAVVPAAGCMGPAGFKVGVSGGATVAARSKNGGGTGWEAALNIGIGELHGGDPRITDLQKYDFSQLVGRAGYSKIDFGDEGEIQYVSVELFVEPGFLLAAGLFVGWAGHWNEDGDWGTGPTAGLAWGWYGPHAECGAAMKGYLSFGRRDGEFDVGIEGRAELLLGLRF